MDGRMPDMETQKICPNCRKPLPPDVPLGLCPECLIKSGFPTGTEPGVSGEAAAERFVPPPVEEIAQLFPQLEILGFIGKGGMGAVYKARQPALDRLVALKVLPPAIAGDPGFAERFNREARALARLNHPNIVAIHDFGCIRSRRGDETEATATGAVSPPHVGGHEGKPEGLFYLVMEFVDGANLREVEHAGKLAPEQALAIVPQICDALQFAHNEGIVHRDIKPENLLIDKKGRVKIADFGIAKMFDGRDALLRVQADPQVGPAHLTETGHVIGTPHYMAPEQIEKPLTVDHRADIYSLGVVFYEMLTGELPLGKFQPPSKKVQIDVRLDEVVLQALEKEPSRRYQQASQVKTAVDTIAGTPTMAAAGFAAQAGNTPSGFSIPANKTTSDKAVLPAFLLAFFFGVFGAHRFYVGKIWTACVQLAALGGCILLIIACATTGGDYQPTLGILLGFLICGCGIWATIDWILIVCKAFSDGQGRRITHWLHPQNGDLKAAGSPITGPPPTPPPGGTVPPTGTGSQPAPLTPGEMPAAHTGRIVAPAVGLMVGALWKLLSALTALFFVSGYNHWPETLLGNFGIGSFSGMADVAIVLFKVIPGLLIWFGAFQMLRLRSHAWAMAAAILSIVACSLIGLPMGIWALIILMQPDVRETFARATALPPSRTGPGPWLLAAGAGVIVIGLFFIVVLAHEVFPEISLFGGKPGVTARADATSGSSTPEMATPVPSVPPENAAPAPVPPPIRIKAGSSQPLTDSEGNLWLADQGFADGQIAERSDNLAIVNTKDPELYQSERYGMTSFSYPVPNGNYVVKLHFAETYDAIKGPGGRVFTYIVEGREFKNFDVWDKAGGAQRACVESVNVEVTDGNLNIYFIHQQENPEINGIEILPASATGVVETPPPPQPVEKPSQAYVHREKILADLSTSDPFQQRFNRTFPLSAGGRFHLDNVNGRIEIAGWDRNEVSIKALKHGNTPESVEAVKININSSPTEIAIHTELPPGETGFSWSWLWSGDWKRNNATVDYAIQVPQHARLKQISSVNGQIVIEDVSGDIEASTVNGGLQTRDTAGDLKLSTVNGGIEAGLASLGGNQTVSFSTVNGHIEATLPANADATVSASTVNGGLSSEFPALVVKKEFPVSSKLKGTLGNGSARVEASSVNGRIHFR